MLTLFKDIKRLNNYPLKRNLVTGGAGYIGSHTLLSVLAAGYEACVIDNFSNSHPDALTRVGRLSNRSFDIHQTDLRAVSYTHLRAHETSLQSRMPSSA